MGETEVWKVVQRMPDGTLESVWIKDPEWKRTYSTETEVDECLAFSSIQDARNWMNNLEGIYEEFIGTLEVWFAECRISSSLPRILSIKEPRRHGPCSELMFRHAIFTDDDDRIFQAVSISPPKGTVRCYGLRLIEKVKS